MDYGKCACCDKPALTYCFDKDSWVCGDCYTPQEDLSRAIIDTRLTEALDRNRYISAQLERAIKLLKAYYIEEWHGIGCQCRNCLTRELLEECEQ